jgi:hypothetical protein
MKGRRLQRVRDAISRPRGVGRGALLWVEAVAAIAAVTAVGIGLVNHFTAGPGREFPGEGKRIVAFRQVANRICIENRKNMHRALVDGRSRIERLGFVARGIGWDLNDLESITPPPSRFDAFESEVGVRRRIRRAVLALQHATELGDRGSEAGALAALETLETESRELSLEAGLVRCMRILPSIPELMRA